MSIYDYLKLYAKLTILGLKNNTFEIYVKENIVE